MNFDVEINNIGKLKDAKVSVRPLTILAGPNSTGKSFVSKILYSTLYSLNTNHYFEELQRHLFRLLRILRAAEWHLIEYDNDEQLLKIVEKTKNLIITTIQETRKNVKDLTSNLVFPIFLQSCESIVDVTKEVVELVEDQGLEGNLMAIDRVNEIIKELEGLKNYTGDQVFFKSFYKILKLNLEGNFQVSNLNHIIGDVEKLATIRIGNKGSIQIKSSFDEEEVRKTSMETDSLTPDDLISIQNNSSVIYLESPFYWKQRRALLKSRRSAVIGRYSVVVPKFFKDLSEMLYEELKGEPCFSDILQEIKGKTIKGEIIISDVGDLVFKGEKQNRSHSLSMTSTGVVQLGLIALLIERKILNKDSVLFIDEPETNLHPEWQVKMMEILFKLVKSGAKVVMATHSADMLNWLSKNLTPEDAHLVSVNQMMAQEDGTATTFNPQETDIYKKIKAVKKVLTSPYTKLFLQKDLTKKED